MAVRSRGEAAVRVSRCDGLACRVILPRLCCCPSLGTPPHVHRVGAVRWLSANGSAGVETHPAQLDTAAHLLEGLHWIRSGAWLQDDKIAVLDTGRADGSRHVLITCQQQHALQLPNERLLAAGSAPTAAISNAWGSHRCRSPQAPTFCCQPVAGVAGSNGGRV